MTRKGSKGSSLEFRSKSITVPQLCIPYLVVISTQRKEYACTIPCGVIAQLWANNTNTDGLRLVTVTITIHTNEIPHGCPASITGEHWHLDWLPSSHSGTFGNRKLKGSRWVLPPVREAIQRPKNSVVLHSSPWLDLTPPLSRTKTTALYYIFAHQAGTCTTW